MSGYKWVAVNGVHKHTSHLILIGVDKDGVNLYVGRAKHAGDLVPAKAKPESGIAYVSYDGCEFAKHEYELLVRTEFHWIPDSNGHVPHHAVKGGRTSDGERLYCGRSRHNGIDVGGKIAGSHHCLYFPYDGKEWSHKEYEVLCRE